MFKGFWDCWVVEFVEIWEDGGGDGNIWFDGGMIL